MEDNVLLKDLLTDIHNEVSREHAYNILWQHLRVPRWSQKALSEAQTEEIKQDCLQKLLVPPHEGFITSMKPLNYAQAAFENALKNRLRKLNRRRNHRDKAEEHLKAEQEEKTFPTEHELNARLDAKKALDYLEQLTPRQRVAVLLTHLPQSISNEDWMIVAKETEKPTTLLDDDDSSKILFPPKDMETTAQKYQRLNSFRRLRKRAYEVLRQAIEENG